MGVNTALGTHVRNVVIACPDGTFENGKAVGAPRELAMFYAELLAMQIVREDWLKVGVDRRIYPQLAFGDGPTANYRAPRWPDPEFPEQLRIDFPVADPGLSAELATRLGATPLEESDNYRLLADPVGHPFGLYFDPAEHGPIGRVTFNCFSPRSLAAFWRTLLGMTKTVQDSSDFVLVAVESPLEPMLGFRHGVFPAPRWPDPAYPQQIHLDLHFDDSSGAQDLAQRLGAIRLPAMGGSCPVYADPASHPFCLCTAGQ